MKKAFLLFFVIFFHYSARTQSMGFDWVQVWYNLDSASVLAYDLTLDDERNVYLYGMITDTSDFDPGPGVFLQPTNSSPYEKNTFVTRFDSAGNFQWVTMLYTTGAMQTKSIATDPDGNVYITGHFTNSIYCDVQGSPATFNSVADEDIFLAKINSSGTIEWVKTYGGIYDDKGGGVISDEAGNVYFTGYFADSVYFDSGNPASGVYEYAYDIFVVKLNPAGGFEWAFTINDPNSMKFFLVNDIALSNNQIFITGYYEEFNGDSIDFDPGPGSLLFPSGGGNIFLYALDTSGNFQWANWYGSSGYDPGGISLETGSGGNILMTGNATASTIDFDPSSSQGEVTWTYPGFFLLNLDAAGNYLWVKSFHPSASTDFYSLSLDGEENIFLQGSFNQTLDFDPGPGTYNLTQSGWASFDIFITKLDQSGNFLWADSYHTPSSDGGYGIEADQYGNLYGIAGTGAGSATDTIMFGNYEFINDGNMRFFYKLVPCGSEMIFQTDDSTLIAESTGATYQWLDCNNGYTPITGATEREFTPLQRGSYALAATNHACTDTSECINITIDHISTNDIEMEDQLILFPNPSDGKLFIRSIKIISGTIRVFSLEGKLMSEEKINGTIHQAELPEMKGLYLVEVEEITGEKKYFKVVRE